MSSCDDYSFTTVIKEDEKYLIGNHHKPIDIDKTKNIIKQLKNCVCKIILNNAKATGFFCNIKLNNELSPVLITNQHVIDEEKLKNIDSINLTLKDDKTSKKIRLHYPRRVYSSEKYDTTIIQILPEIDEIDKNKNCLSLDDKINEEYNILRGLSVYALQYPERENASISYGIILKDPNKHCTHDFKHICSTNGGSSGAPILDLETNKVIGIHCIAIKKEIEQTTIKGKTITKVKENDFNGGIFLKEPIFEFQNNFNCHIINNPRSINNDVPNINRCDFSCNIDNYSGLYGLSKLIIIHNFLNKLKSIKKSVPNSNQDSNKKLNQNSNQNSNQDLNKKLNQNSNQNSNQNTSNIKKQLSNIETFNKKVNLKDNNRRKLPKIKGRNAIKDDKFKANNVITQWN